MTGSGAESRFAPPAVRSIDATDGVALLYRVWEVDDPRARVLVVHGLGEHGGRYTALAEALLSRQITCCAPDLRGHGVSGGRRGHVVSFEQYISDLERVLGAIGAPSPLILFGHSLGGLIALRAIQTGRVAPLAGAVLSAPALELAGPDPWWRNAAAAVLSRLTPTVALPNGIDPADLSHDADAVAAYRNDPLVHDRITPRLFDQMRRAMRAANEDAEQVRVPLLLLAPGEDRIARAPAAIALADRLPGEAKVLSYPGLFHEPLHEQEGAAVLRDVIEWISGRIA